MSNDNRDRFTPSGQPVTPANGGVPPLFTPPLFYTPILYPLIPPTIPRAPDHDGQFRGPPTIYRQIETGTGPVPAFTPRARNERRVEIPGIYIADRYKPAWYYDATDYERNLQAAECEYRTARSHAGYLDTAEGMPTCLIQAVGGAFHPAVEVNGLWVGPQPTVDFPPDLVQPIVPMHGRMGAVRMGVQPGLGDQGELRAKLAQATAALSEVHGRLHAAEHDIDRLKFEKDSLKETNAGWKQAIEAERRRGDSDYETAKTRIAALREANVELQAKVNDLEESSSRHRVYARADLIKAIKGREDAEGRAETAERRVDIAERRAETAEVMVQSLLKRIATDMARQATTDGIARATPEVKANPPSMKRKATVDNDQQPDTKRVKPDTARTDTALGTSARKSHARRLPRSIARTSARYATAWNRNASARNTCREVIPFAATVIAAQTAAPRTATNDPPTQQQPVAAPPHRAAAGNVNAPKVWSFARPTASSLQHAARQAKSRSRPVSSDAAALGAQVVGGQDGGFKAVNPRKTVAPRK